ncbi:MAG TPA: TlpA disulfide reductase family protein [Dehalococcoidia bacterium]|nr:TlpA disulfide reductase family protein [Dehalococcoidia bacterium]
MPRKTDRSVQQRLIALVGIVAIVGVAVLLLYAGGLLGNQSGGEGIEDVVLLDPPPAESRGDLDIGSARGNLAQDFEISDFDGERHRLSDLRGKVVFVNFWATWCLPCQFELPDIAALQSQHPDDLVVLLVNRRQSVSQADDYLDEVASDTGWIKAVDPTDRLYDDYRALAMPSSYIVDPDGVIAAVGTGPISLADMETAYQRALARDPDLSTSTDGEQIEARKTASLPLQSRTLPRPDPPQPIRHDQPGSSPHHRL